MSYFLRNFPHPLDELATLLGHGHEDEHQMFQAVRCKWMDLLEKASERRFGKWRQLCWGREHGEKADVFCSHNAAQKRDQPENERNECQQQQENWENAEANEAKQRLMLGDTALDSLDVVAAPSAFGADAIAQAIVYRLCGIFGEEDGTASPPIEASDCTNPADEWAINRNRGRPFLQNISPKNKTAAKTPDLVGIGLESLFSVLLELNRREPDLCARSLQSLLQLLQVLEAGTLGTQPRAMLARMHELLRELRREGNAQVSAVANACMMSLAVASGHPEFLFAAVYALLCEPKRYVPFNQLASSTNLLPRNLQSMALTVQRHILNIKPGQDNRWMSDPLEHRPLVCEFDVIYTGSALFEDRSDGICRGCLTSDGAFVYLLTVYGFFKLGTGLCETRAGEVLVCNDAVRFNDGSSLYVSNGSLYLRHRHSARLWVLDTETLREIGEIMLPSALVSQGLLFSDGRQFWLAALDDQWHLVCTPLDDSFVPIIGEQSPNSADGDVRTAAANPPRAQPSQVRLMECEFCAFGELEETHEQMLRSIPAKLRGITADLQLGLGIGFLLSRCGKVFFAGPASDSDFGLCSPPTPFGCWTRLNVPEPIVSMAFESNSRTLVLRSGAGNLWLVGAQQAKTFGKSPKRRQPSKETTAPVARRLKVPSKKKCVSVSVASVGGGSLALVTESGRVFLLGRHVLNNAQHAQATLQQMSPHANAPQSLLGMENIALAQVALGKTHLAGIAKNGALYATGLNNQNQCGRTGEQQQNQQEKSRAQSASQAGARPSEFSAISSNSQSVSSSNSSSCCQFCSLSQHLFVDDLASLCVRCGQCSARGSACPFSKSKSVGGTACACARSGPSCCVRCGLCKECVQTDRRAHAARKQASPKAVRLQQLTTARGTTLCKAPLAREEEISEPGRARRTEEGMSGGISSGTTRVFPPERVLLQPQPNIKVSTVSVGNFHTVVLSADNQVYTFGANTHGQLGTGDTKSLTGVHKLAFPANIQIVQAVAGANHSVLRTIDGRLITFGAHKAGQLGRRRIATPASSPSGVTAVRQWFAEPGFVPGFGQAYGRLANWASAQGDRTVVQVQQQLISRAELADGRITASGDVLMVLPSAAGRAQQHKNNTRGYFMVGWNNNGTGTATGDRMALLRFRHRIWPTRQAQRTELDLGLCSFCFDPRHLNLLWAYDPVRMRVFALSDVPPPTGHGQEANEPQSLLKHRQMVMRSTELMVPTSVEDESEFDQQGSTEISQARFSDVQLAIFLLSTVHTLCLAISAGAKQQELPNKIDQCAKSDDSEVVELDTDCAAASLDGVIRSVADRNCRVVRRFENFGGGWGYSAHCVEAIQFMTNKEVMFCGVGLFGGRGEYTARLKLYRAIEDEVETEETEQQHCVELLAETDEVLYECAPRETATLQLERPIPIIRSRWHLIWVQIQGPSSDCGAGGQEAVQVEMSADTENTSDSLVELHFRASPLSNNGTNVEVGQIPELYFLPVMDGEGEEPCSTAARDDGSTQKFKPKSANSDHPHDHDDHLLIVSVSPFFHNICPSSIQQLLHIIEWALEGVFRPGTEETGELINCDALWRQERAAFVAVLAVRLIRHFLHVPSGDRAHPEGLVAFHRLLKCILSRQTLGQDNRISTFVMAEAALAYTILAYKFAPNPALFRMRLVDQITRKRENAAKNWWLLALLCSMRRMKKNLLQIIKIPSAAANEKDAKGQKRRSAEMAERMWRDEQSAKVSWQSDECPPLTILKFLCEIAFGEMSDDLEEENAKNGPIGRREGAGGYDAISGEESDNNKTARGINIAEDHPDNRLPDRLNSVAQHLITSIGHLLITRALPRPKTRGASPALFQSPSRFRHISPQAQWEVGANQQASAWDAVAFRVEGHGIALAGVGIFSGSSTGPEHFELELVQNQCPSSDDSASGERNWRLVERVTGRPDTFPTQIVPFAHLCPLKPGICYAVKVRFGGAGKTLYGEGGILSVKLRDQIRLHFLPCDLSRNGTTVSRGQFPFLLFSVVDAEDKSAGGAEGEEEEGKAVEREKSPAEELFLHLLRQIVQRMSRRMVHRTTASEDLLRPGEQRMCAALLALANVWVEGCPRRAFDVVAVLDEATPILAHVNAAAGEEQDGHGLDLGGSASSGPNHERHLMDAATSSASSSSGINLVAVDSKLPLKANFCSSTSSSAPSQSPLPTVTVESLHPYRPGQLTVHQINVPHSDFLCVHFDSQCQTAQPTDSVWVYVKGNGENILPVANFYGRNWPRGQLLVPGDCLWVILESGPRQLENDHNNAFGFRCSVEPISAQKANSVRPNVSLERHFVWCLSNACRALLGSGGRGGQLQMNNKSLHELLARHGCLLLRGMHFGLPNGTMPSMAQLTEQSEFGVDQQQGTKELVFLKEFAEGQHPELSAFLCHQPVVSLVNSYLKIVGPEDVRVGNPVEINFVVRDQHKREVAPVGQLEVTVTLSSGAMEGSVEEAEGGATDWGGLKAEQTKIAFRPVPCGRALYQCVSAIAQFAHWSLEELRFAFVFTRPLRNRLRLCARGDKSEILSAIWTPQRVGTYLLQCAVDGIALSGQITVLEVREGQNRRLENPTNSLRAQNFAHSDVKTQFANANAKVDSGPPLKSAHFPASSPFFALKVRVHCSLSAPQIGLVHRGSSLQYTEMLRNEDGVWLRITEETKRDILGIGNKVQMESEAWVLQLNAHLQTEFLQLCPSPSVDGGNFLAQQPPPQLQQLSTTGTTGTTASKRCPSPVTISILDSPKFRKGKKAISPQLFEAFRWVFVAAAWHSSETDGCTAEELIKAAQSLLEFGSSGQRRWDTAQGHGNASQMPPALRTAATAWRKLSDKLLEEILMQKSQSFGVSDEEILSQPAAHSSEHPTTAFVPCELCGGRRVPRPFGKHLGQEHPGCGGEAGTFGYNSAGHWAIGGGSAKCGESGGGPAVWYSFCARCRDKKLRIFNKTDSGSEEMAQRMKRNAQFLLELNCPEGVESAERKRQKAVLEVQMYPKALNTINKSAPEGRGVPKWHSSDPCGDAVGFLPSSYAFADQRLTATDSSKSVPSGAVLLADPCSRLPSSLDHILNFVSASHHLPSLRANFRSSFFSSIAFSFAFRLWGWLIRLATSHQSVSDVIWHFLSALPPLSPRAPLRPHPAQLCPLAGPLPVLRMVSEFHALLHSLAVVLQSSAEGADPRFKCLRASDLTALCFRAWTFQLTDHEQSLLPVIRSLLSAVGNALGTSSDTTLTTESANSTQKLREKSLNVSNEHNLCFQLQLEDLSTEGQLDASSRAQMIGCLIDGSCDTFWESGEEERGRTERRLGVNFGTGAKMMALYIDNISDEGFRVARVSITSGSGRQADQVVQGDEAEQQLLLLDTSLDTDFSGWIKCAIDGLKRVEINLWGDELGCRVRQLRILGIRESPTPNGVPSGAIPVERVPREVLPPKSVSHQLLFSSGAQSDAFALFQSLATQVLCDRIAPEGTEGTDDNALREQVLDMVSARAQLMHPLQQFVGTHLANAVQREVQSLRAHRKRNFSYINALLHLLVRMNSSAAQPTQELIDQRLLMALSDLWLFAPEVVQKKALNAFECLIAGGQTETKVPEDIEVAVLAERLLVMVVKVLQMQVKERVVGAVRRQQLAKHTIETFSRDVPLHWSVDRHSSAETAHLVIRFLRGLRPCPWRSALRVQIGHFVLRLCTSVRESLSKGNSLADCVRCAAFWLSVAALTAMDGTDWLEEVPAYQRMKSATDCSRAPLCDNHDDGRTRAQLRCQTCALSLCRDCFAVLHLSRRNQSHRAQPIVAGLLGSTVPRMDFHEGCNRLRLASTDQHQPLLLVLVNPNSLVGLVELGTEVGKMPNSRKSTVCAVMPSSSSSLASSRKSSAAQDTIPKALEEGGEEGIGEQIKLAAEDKCRFCASKLSTAEQRLNGFCEFEECRQKDALACESILPCGHLCQGVRDERQCPPCLQCPSDQFHQDADDLCAICFSERLGEAPCVQLRCLHFFHWRCVRTALEKRWPGPRISFRFMQCPLCKGNIQHPAFEDLLVPLKELENDVKRKARLRLEYERGGGWGTAPAATSSESAGDESALLETALDKYMYVQCSRCLKAYFGGESQCQLGLEEVGFGTEFDPAELVCGGCAAEVGHGGAVVCERHGTDFLEFKCRFCCSVAVYFCFGTTHFCAACHSDFQRLVQLPRHALPKCPVAPRAVQMPDLEPCPLRIASHPPTGEEFALGCGICRNLRTF